MFKIHFIDSPLSSKWDLKFSIFSLLIFLCKSSFLQSLSFKDSLSTGMHCEHLLLF